MSEFTADTDMPIRKRNWALVRDGIVTEVRSLAHHLAHPFDASEVQGARVLDVSGVPCHVGYMADAKGNVTPAEGRDSPIPDGLPAYHAGPGVIRLPVNVAAELAGNAPIVDESPKMPQSTATVVPQNTTVELNPELPKHSMSAEEADPSMSKEEPGDEPKNVEPTAKSPEPKSEKDEKSDDKGFAAVDKKASDKK